MCHDDVMCLQMEGETSAYIQRMKSLKEQLKEQASKFELIEQEEDKKQRKLKQKEYVYHSTIHVIYYNMYTQVHIYTCVLLCVYKY